MPHNGKFVAKAWVVFLRQPKGCTAIRIPRPGREPLITQRCFHAVVTARPKMRSCNLHPTQDEDVVNLPGLHPPPVTEQTMPKLQETTVTFVCATTESEDGQEPEHNNQTHVVQTRHHYNASGKPSQKRILNHQPYQRSEQMTIPSPTPVLLSPEPSYPPPLKNPPS